MGEREGGRVTKRGMEGGWEGWRVVEREEGGGREVGRVGRG